MIAQLTGSMISVEDGRCVIDVNGVGYLVHASTRTLSALPAPPAIARVLVETQVREDAITLYGFADGAERDWFRLLTTVQGVGAKVALGVLSALSPKDLVAAIAAGGPRQPDPGTRRGGQARHAAVVRTRDQGGRHADGERDRVYRGTGRGGGGRAFGARQSRLPPGRGPPCRYESAGTAGRNGWTRRRYS